MDEYIEREAAFEAITDLAGKAPTRSAYEAVWKSARALKKIPAADVAPVVRCKDCKHCDPENYHCDHPMGTAAPLKRKPDDFCSYGELKEGAD